MRAYDQVELGNGIRIIHKEVTNTKIAHVGIMLDIGSRDEEPAEQGLAHFWEHMAFKGTKKRKAFHIINRLETLGGELNAYTTKEKICFYASVLDNHLNKAVDLIADITFHATFPQAQIDREKMVILEEMAMYRDTPEDAIQDDFDELVFANHSLGKNILGNEETVNSFRHKDFVDFINKNQNTTKIILSSVGNYSIKKLEKLARKQLDLVQFKNHTPQRNAFSGYQISHQEKSREISQVHFALGLPAFKLEDPRRIPFFILTNILGGPAMNSRLNLSLREKQGFVYSAEAQYTPYTDTGLFSIMFATDPKNLRKSISTVKKEIKRLQEKPLGNLQLHSAKQQLKGQLAMSDENNNSMMLMMAKSLLDLNRVPSLENLFKKIDQVTSRDLQNLANEGLKVEKMSSLAFFPA